MVEQSADVICYLVSDRFTYVSPSASTIFGWNPQGMIGTTGLDLIYEPDLPILEEVLTRRTSGEESGSIRHQLRVICGDGSLKWSETSAHSERDPAGEMRTALIIRDISDRKHLEQESRPVPSSSSCASSSSSRLPRRASAVAVPAA